MRKVGEPKVAASPPGAPRLTLIVAYWCPHCSPLSIDEGSRLARELGLPLRILDIDDPAQERIADDLVRECGDWSEDYLVPQLFLERPDGRVAHLLTGVPGDPEEGTRSAWKGLHARGAAILDDAAPARSRSGRGGPRFTPADVPGRSRHRG